MATPTMTLLFGAPLLNVLYLSTIITITYFAGRGLFGPPVTRTFEGFSRSCDIYRIILLGADTLVGIIAAVKIIPLAIELFYRNPLELPPVANDLLIIAKIIGVLITHHYAQLAIAAVVGLFIVAEHADYIREVGRQMELGQEVAQLIPPTAAPTREQRQGPITRSQSPPRRISRIR